jgi:hypothetical protein
MSVIYVGSGVAFTIGGASMLGIQAWQAGVLGLVLILYGVFRAARAWASFKESK